MGVSLSAGRGASKKTRATPNMNVTPLVDVVLVLLIIFMIVVPLLNKQFWLQLPKQNVEEKAQRDSGESVVLAVKKDGAFEINGASVPRDRLREKVARVMAARSDKVVYFDAADDAPYASTVEAMDLARQGGAKTIAILTNKVVQ